MLTNLNFSQGYNKVFLLINKYIWTKRHNLILKILVIYKQKTKSINNNNNSHKMNVNFFINTIR